MSPSPADNPIVELELPQLDLSHADLRIVDCPSQSRLVLSIEAQGQLLPVVVVRQGHRNILIDGFARCRALRRLGKDTVWALVLAHTAKSRRSYGVIANSKVVGQPPSKKLGSFTSCI